MSNHIYIHNDDNNIIINQGVGCGKFIRKGTNYINHKFCFIIPGRNAYSYIKTLFISILNQKYNNYRIIYISDGSNDKNDQQVLNFITETNLDLLLIYNKSRKGPSFSRYIGSQLLNDDEICIFLDADDQLYHNCILNLLNLVYNIYDIGCTFGGDNSNLYKFKTHVNVNKYIRGRKSDNDNDIHPYFPHLRTCKSIYVKNISKTYLQDENKEWFMFCSDVALFTSLVEICNYKFICIMNQFIIYNRDNSVNVDTGYAYAKITKGCISGQGLMDKRKNYHNCIKNKRSLTPELTTDLTTDLTSDFTTGINEKFILDIKRETDTWVQQLCLGSDSGSDSDSDSGSGSDSHYNIKENNFIDNITRNIEGNRQ